MSRYDELAAKVGGFFDRVQAKYGREMQCSSGCADCCHTRLTITAVEANAIRDELTHWVSERRTALAAHAANAPADRCAALDRDGRCLIYAAWPIVCRSHGAPIRMRDERSLPVVTSCFRNFTNAAPEPAYVIDQETLSTLVLAVDREAGGDGTRFDLAELLASC